MDKDQKRQEITVKRMRDFVLGLLILIGAIMLLKCFGNPHEEGFFCADRTLRYPYRSSTVPSKVLYFFCLVVPILIMVIHRYTSDEMPQNAVSLYERNVPLWFLELFVEAEEYFFGAACCEFFTMTAKYTVGRLRPHFIDTCVPFPDCRKLGDVFMKPGDYSCRGSDKKKIFDSRTSFPSGHASLSAFTAVYMAFYLQAKMKPNDSVVLKHMLQFLFFTLSWVTGLSRVMDYKHHWSDVFAGFIIGVVTGLIEAIYVSSLFRDGNAKDVNTKPEKSTT